MAYRRVALKRTPLYPLERIHHPVYKRINCPEVENSRQIEPTTIPTPELQIPTTNAPKCNTKLHLSVRAPVSLI